MTRVGAASSSAASCAITPVSGVTRKLARPIDMAGYDHERFSKFVVVDDAPAQYRPDLGPCWRWRGSKSALGYGYFYMNSSRFLAHRVSFAAAGGELDVTLELDHLCRNPRCVRPEHLEQVPHKVNAWRGLNGLMVTHCPRGHAYDEANTYIDTRSNRVCRACMDARNAADRAHRARLGKVPRVRAP